MKNIQFHEILNQLTNNFGNIIECLVKTFSCYTMNFWQDMYQYSKFNTDLIIKSTYIKNPSVGDIIKNKKDKYVPLYRKAYINYKCELYTFFMSNNQICFQFLLHNNFIGENPSIYYPYFDVIPFYIIFEYELDDDDIYGDNIKFIKIAYVNFGIRNGCLTNYTVSTWNYIYI